MYKNYQVSITEHRFFTFVLSSGNTFKIIFEELSENYVKKIDWIKVLFSWTAEHCVLPTHIGSNYGAPVKYLLRYISGFSVYRVLGEKQPNITVKLYEDDVLGFCKLKGRPVKFDLILLGIGEDASVTFVFPSFKNTRSIVNLVNFFIKIIKKFYLIIIFQCCIKASKINLFMSPQKKHSLLDKNSNLFVHSIEAEVQLVGL